MAGRKTTPLFELMSRGADATPAPATRERKPVVRVELKPREPSFAPEPADEHPWPQTWAGLPIKTWSILGAAFLVMGVGIWGVAWSLGKKQGEASLQPFIRRDPPPVVEPALADPGPQQPPIVQPQPQQPQQARTGELRANAGYPLPPAPGTDPRQVGLNYLYLATLPLEDARAAVNFLRQNGVDAHFLLVDTGGGSANNPRPGAKGRVFVLPGLTREQLGTSIKTNLETEVVRLGAIWQREHRGSSNFEKHFWEKLK